MKLLDQIIKDLKTRPNTWMETTFAILQPSTQIRIPVYAGRKGLSIIKFGESIALSFFEKYKLWRAINDWRGKR